MAYINDKMMFLGVHLHVNSEGEEELEALLEEIENAVDGIIALQNSLVRGDE